MPFDYLAGALLPWYDENARDLPWRREVTPYRVWVSEIMLQQTRIEAAKGYFERFMEAFPTVRDLADAEEENVLKRWEGLGYYSRARNLHKTAKLLVSEYDGELPPDAALLRKLPGIGDYTAGAIASIAYGLPEPAVDGNVLRILARLTCCPDSVGDAAVKKRFRAELREAYPSSRCGDFTSAIMELGETVCIPGAPDCANCPLNVPCEAHHAGLQTAYPIMPAKRPRRIEEKTVFLLVHEDRVALIKRPDKGLLAGLWELPNTEGFLTAEEALETARSWGCEPTSAAFCGKAAHIFTHLEWHMLGCRIECGAASSRFQWADESQRRSVYAVPTAFRAFTRLL